MGNPHQMGAAVMAAGRRGQPAGRGAGNGGAGNGTSIAGCEKRDLSDGREGRIWGVCSPCLFRGLAFWAVRKLRQRYLQRSISICI